jgi:hypothetical protein
MKPVLITTDSDRRGVFFGYTECDLEKAIDAGVIDLVGFRNCIYWSRSVGGVFGLAESGPSLDCKIGAKVDRRAYFNGVTFVSEVSDIAVQAWESAPCVE